MINHYFLPAIGILGLVSSFYYYRKGRDKKFTYSFLVFLIPVVMDLLMNTPTRTVIPAWFTVIKIVTLCIGWFLWITAVMVKK